MKSQKVCWGVIGLMLMICISNLTLCRAFSFNQNDQSFFSPIPSDDEFPFDANELNWTSEICLIYNTPKYFHFTICCFTTELDGGYQFNFTYALEIDSTHDQNFSHSCFGLTNHLNEFLIFALFEVQLIHNEYVDVGFLYIPDINENTTKINAASSLIIFQDEIPRGYQYKTSTLYTGESSSGAVIISESRIITWNPKQLQSNFDGDVLWVHDIKKFGFKLKFHLPDLLFTCDFRGNYTFFLGDGVHFGNSSIDMLYNLSTSFSPSIFSAFNITHSLSPMFRHESTSTGCGGSSIHLNQSNYNDITFQNLTEHTEVIADNIYNADNSSVIFNETFLLTQIVFQLENISDIISFEMEIKQVVFDEEQTSTNTENTSDSFIAGFLLSYLVGISVISVLCITVQIIFRKNHPITTNTRVKHKMI